jgi:DNA-binding response OmpR family regulator
MYALAPIDDDSKPIEAVRVAVVTIVHTATSAALIAELERHSMQVTVATAEVLQAEPSVPVYAISMDAPLVGVLADKVVAWSSASELRPGLIALVEAGTPRESELLLEAGFDDVVIAPTSVRELVGRIRAVYRRVHWSGSTNRLRYADLTLDLAERALWADGQRVPLTSIELAVMRALIGARGRPLSRAELLDTAWGDGELEISERAVDNVILRLRRKLPRPEVIETVRSVGFRIGRAS